VTQNGRISKDELMAQVWAGVVVEEHNIPDAQLDSAKGNWNPRVS
jgi:DNA-binding winged helix-turn-helix (wHTH) protein